MLSEELTGVPSIDKPWSKYYCDAEKNIEIPKGSMFDYLREKNAKYPNDIAIEYYGNRVKYGELLEQIDRCCRNLSALGVKKGDIVTVQAIPIPQVIVMIYAINRIGACGNMLYPDAKAEDIVSSMTKTNSHYLFAVDKIFSTYEEKLPANFDATIVLMSVLEYMPFFTKLLIMNKAGYKKLNKSIRTLSWNKFISGKGLDYQENHDNSLPAFMLRTGGTTGTPKEVVLDSRGFNTVAEATYYSKISAHWDRQKTSVLLLPPFIAFGIGSGVHHSLSFGFKLVIALDVSPSAASKLLCKSKTNYIVAGTVQIEQYMKDLEQKKDVLNYIDLIAVGGDAMNVANERKIQQFFLKHSCMATPVKGYGLTETTATVIAERVDVHQMGSVGIPLSICNMKVVDPDTREELTYDTPGEICLSSPGIMQGYYHEQSATDDVIEVIDGERWLRTGDIGIISKDGLLTITGRIKRIIVCKEGSVYHKVFPLVLEEKLAKISGVLEISIVGKPDKNAGNVTVAYVVTDNRKIFETVKRELIAYCDNNLEKYERPVDFIYVSELPRTMIGKIDYRKLEELAIQ